MKARSREDQLIVRYLLGLASELEQSQIESRYFKNQHFYEQVLVAEDELICDYINRQLPTAERQQFDKHFLSTEHRRKKFEATRKLMAYIADQGFATKSFPAPNAANTNTPNLSLKGWIAGLLTPGFNAGWMLAATLLLLVCGIWLTKQISATRLEVQQAGTTLLNQQEKNELLLGASTRQGAEAAAKTREAQSLSELVANGAENLSAELKTQSGRNNAFVPLVLSAVRSADAKIEIEVPKTAAALTLQLRLGNVPLTFSRYQIKLSSTTTATSNWQWEVSPLNQQLTIEMPTKNLTPGIYNLVINGLDNSQTAEFAGEYFLAIKTV